MRSSGRRRVILDGAGVLERYAPTMLFVIVVAVAAVVTLLGAPLWPLFMASALPWTIIASSRMGSLAAVTGAVLVTLWLLVMVLIVTPFLPLGLHESVVAIWMLIGLGGSLLMTGRPLSLALPRASTVATWLPASLGGIFWLLLSQLGGQAQGAARLSLVVLGDSANNVLFARLILYNDGIAIGPDQNPVPLPAAMLALAMSPGRDDLAPGELLRNDLTAFAGVWALVIAGVCLLAGVVAAAITARTEASNLTIAAVGLFTSFVPLTWFVTGYPIEFGFFNAHITLLIVLAAFAGYLVEEKSPAHSLALLCLTATLILAVWSPFVLLPAALALVVLWRHHRSLRTVRGWSLRLLIFAFAQLLLYGLAVVLPSFLALSDALSAPGGAYSPPRWVLAGLIVGATLLAVLGFRTPRHPIVYGVLAVSAALLLGLAFLLFMSRNAPSPWTYYPLKYLWLATVVMGLLVIGVVAAAIVHRIPTRGRRLVAFLAAGVTVVGALWWMPWATTREAQAGPVLKVVQGRFLGHGDEVSNQIVELADPTQSHLLWGSGEEHEATVNFWLMQMWADGFEGTEDLRSIAYGPYGTSDEALCHLVDLMGGGTIVHSLDEELGQRLESVCPELDAVVVSSAS